MAEPVTMSPQTDALRRAHLDVEANIRAFGALLVLAGASYALLGVGMVAIPASEVDGSAVLIGAFLAVAGVGTVALGVAVWRLHPAGRLLASALTLVTGGYGGFGVLFALFAWGKKGQMVFSERYRREVVPATRHVQYRGVPLMVWLAVLVVAGAVVIGMNLGPVR